MRKILIAGCGYVGQALAPLLAADGDLVFCARRRPVPDVAGATLRNLAVDLAHGPLDALPAGLDAVVFAAAPGGGTPQHYEDVYVRALGRVADHLRRTGAPEARLILTSSTSVYGQTSGEWVDETSPADGAAPSGALVRRGELRLQPGDVAVRLGGIYGPGRESFLASVRTGALAVNPAASPFTNRIHRDDAAAILRHLLALPAPLAVYNAVDCAPAPRAEVALWLATRLGVPLAETTAEDAPALRGNKRVRNDRLLASGYAFLFPTYREGYGALIAGPP